MKYENQILDAIETIVNKKVETAGYDRTIQAKIISCDDPTIGKYRVQYQDSVFYAYSGSSEINYVPGSEVYILVPNNDMSRDKSILGSVSRLGKNYAVAAEGEEAFEVIGNNCVEDSKEYKLCSYKTQEFTIYQYGVESDNNLRLNLKSIEEYIKSSTSIILAATIKTSLPTEQQFRGNYGILYEMIFKDNATGEAVTKQYFLDVNQFEGNPYRMPNFTRQVGIFDIDGANFQRIEKIKLFCYDFPNQDNNKNDDIIIKNFEICGSQPLSAADLESCSLSFVTPQGVYFDNNDLPSATRTIMAQVRVKGKYINPDSQKLPYYWFVENNGVTSLSEDFNAYGGQGWKCLNQKNVIKNASAGTAPVVEWIPADFKYIVKKSDSEAKETKYKCVVIYNNIQLSRIITITNYSSNYEISIESDKGEQFYYDIGNPSLTCKINGEETSSNEYTYQWVEIDNNNNFYTLAENTLSLNRVNSIAEMIDHNKLYILTSDNYIYYYNNSWISTNVLVNSGDNDNTIYNNAVAGYTQLKADIAAERAMAAASQAQLDAYLTIINSYDKIMRVEGRKIHHLQVNTITNFSTYKCSVYHNGVYIGTASIVIRNDLDKKDAYTLIINNGTQAFKYDEAGVSPASDSLDNPQVILPLSFTVYDNLGNALADDIVDKCKFSWAIPLEDTMLKVPDNYDWIIQDDYKTVEGEMYLQYTIRDKYDIKKNNNKIKLTVDYKDMNLVAETDFTFVKEGEPGTNGTEFVCKIVPNTQDTNFGYPMVLNGNINYTPRQSNKWFNTQLWHNGEKIFDGNSSGNTTEGKTANVKWTILQNKYTSNVYDETSLSVTDNGTFTYSGYKGANSPANIVKVIITYDNIEYYATMPVITATTVSGYGVSLIEDTGFRYATYSADGRKPQYDNSKPFELKVTKVINNIIEDISTLTQVNGVNYDWNIRGRIYNPVNRSWVNKEFLKEYSRSDIPVARNTKSYKPIDDFDGECVTNALECIIMDKSANDVARIHIPIHLLLNKYGNAAINGWDGNSVSIDKNGNGVILAPQIGAGQKEADNSFTGMLMGSVKEAGKNKKEVGMFGYNFGERTMFLNAEDGSAIFGKKGPGQIILDPRNFDSEGHTMDPKAMLYSSAYWKNYDDSGKPLNYGSGNKNHQGMLIDLTTPRIEWGNGNFVVDENGHIYAKGGGEIAGWNISDTKLYSTAKVGNNPKITIDSSIAAIYSNNKTSMADTKNGFYIGSDGFALGAYNSIKGHNPFQVNSEGSLFSNSGSIGGYTISDNTLIGGSGSNCVGMSSKSGVQWAFWAGDEIAINAPFHVGHNGELHASKGKIGGWTIGTNKLSGGNMYLNDDGSMGGTNWSITAGGYATFSNVYINNTGGSTNMNWGNFKVDTGGNLEASNAKFTGAIRTGSSITGSTITGGSISIHKGGYYLEMGIATDHPSVSGLNAYGGINMHGNQIGDCNKISVDTITGNSSNVLEINANPTIKGTLRCNNKITGYGFNNFADQIDLWVQVGDTSSTGGGWKQIKIRGGLIYQVN